MANTQLNARLSNRGALTWACVFAMGLSACSFQSVQVALHGKEAVPRWQIQCREAALAIKGGDYSSAEAFYARSIETAASCPERDRCLAFSLSGEGLAQALQLKFGQSAKNLDKSLALYKGLLLRQPTLRAEYLLTVAMLAKVLYEQEKYQRAGELFRETLSEESSKLLSLSEVNRIRQYYAQLLMKSGNKDEAAKVRNEIVDSSPEFKNWQKCQSVGEAVYGVNERQSAAELEKALKIAERIGKDDWRYGVTLSWVGLHAEKAGRLAQAKANQIIAVRTIERSLGPRDVRLIEPLTRLGQICTREGNHQAAIDYMNRAYDIKAHNEPDQPTKTKSAR